MAVTSNGRRVFLYAEGSIRLFDVATGAQIAESLPVDLEGSTSNRLELDEARGILRAHRGPAPGYARHLLALDASTLALLGEGNAGGYGDFHVFQPLKGRGAAGAYVLMSPSDATGSVCWTWIDAMDASGVLRAHVEVANLAGLVPTFEFALCAAAARVLSVPEAPTALAPIVEGQRVTLAWTQPDDTTTSKSKRVWLREDETSSYRSVLSRPPCSTRCLQASTTCACVRLTRWVTVGHPMGSVSGPLACGGAIREWIEPSLHDALETIVARIDFNTSSRWSAFAEASTLAMAARRTARDLYNTDPCDFWSRRSDSNRRPADYESAALPTELRRPAGKPCILPRPCRLPAGLATGVSSPPEIPWSRPTSTAASG